MPHGLSPRLDARSLNLPLFRRPWSHDLAHPHGRRFPGRVQGWHRLSALFGFPVTEKANSVYSGTGVEYLRRGGYGEKGHIGIRTYSMERAITYLKARGAEFIEESRKYDAAGNLSCVYLKEEIAGFAVHIVK